LEVIALRDQPLYRLGRNRLCNEDDLRSGTDFQQLDSGFNAAHLWYHDAKERERTKKTLDPYYECQEEHDTDYQQQQEEIELLNSFGFRIRGIHDYLLVPVIKFEQAIVTSTSFWVDSSQAKPCVIGRSQKHADDAPNSRIDNSLNFPEKTANS
jgi:hypothetical protein